MGRSDERLVRRAARGDRRAFDAIYRRYRHELYRFCLAMTGNPQDAQEALQNTMVNMLRALPGEQRKIKLKPWLYRIARNESIETRRRRRDGELGDGVTVAAGVAETVETRERLRLLLADLAQLPERQRATLVMREMAGFDYAEIAAAFDTSQGSVRQALYEARLRLRRLDTGREISWDEEIERRSEKLSAVAPIAGIGALSGTGAAKAAAASTLLKAATAVAVTVTVVAVAGRVGLVGIPPRDPGRGDGDDTAAIVGPSTATHGSASNAMTSGADRPAGIRPVVAARSRSGRAGVMPHEAKATSEAGRPLTADDEVVSEADGVQQPADGEPIGADAMSEAEEASPRPPDEPGPDQDATPGVRRGGRGKGLAHGHETAAKHRPPQAGPQTAHGHAPPPEAPVGESRGKQNEPRGEPEASSETTPPATGKPESPPGNPEGPAGHDPEVPPGHNPDGPPGHSPEGPPGHSS